MKVALVTGGNRGLGLETSKQLSKKGYRVILTARDRKEGEKTQKDLLKEGIEVDFLQLDVTDPKSIEGAVKFIEKKHARLDVLVNNAGVFPKGSSEVDSFKASPGEIKKTFSTNTVGPFELCQSFIPLMKKNAYGRIVNVSSGMGQFSEMSSGYPAYRISKAALNAVTLIFANEVKGTDILVNSVCPGWVKTDMGGENAPRSLETGASGIVWAATLPYGGPTGGFFRDGKKLNW